MIRVARVYTASLTKGIDFPCEGMYTVEGVLALTNGVETIHLFASGGWIEAEMLDLSDEEYEP